MIGSRIHDFRLERKMSQKDLASLTGVAQSTLSDIEHNRYEPKSSIIAAFARALNTTTDELIGTQEVAK
ncbi:helix-turn-helix domain-containing protein [Loigolactobacillus bifermentans]|nr:helix-turn-helix transcriptional regulator [Loigolactobacillus bifermentans]QGG60113.1 helix-turn-helix domain-containing protein [Loigolactobacillus bifermentans]